MASDSEDRPNFAEIGDYRDIPMLLGLITMNWNRCELTLRQILRDLAAGGDWRRHRLAEPLVHELSSVGIAQAMCCYADEFPDEFEDLGEALRHASAVLERCRAYRNYYIHGIYGVTRYGIAWSNEMLEQDIPVHEAMIEGPFGSVYQKSGKFKSRFIMDYIDKEKLSGFANYLAQFYEHTGALEKSICHYFRRLPFRESAPLPPQLPLLTQLAKPDLSHPKLKPRRSLGLDALEIPPREEEEE